MSDHLRELIATKLGAVSNKDHYALLEIKPDSTTETIIEAWAVLARRLELRGVTDPEVATNGLRLRKAVDEAKAILTDEERRRQYDRDRKGVTVPVPKFHRDPHEDAKFLRLLMTPFDRMNGKEKEIAKSLHQRGAVLFTRGDLEGAERFFRRALDLDDSVGVHHLRVGWVMLQRTGPSDTARQHIEQAVAFDTNSSEAHYALASYWKAVGDHDKYRKELEATARGKPTLPKAEMELGALKAKERRQAEADARAKRIEEAERPMFSLKRLFGRDKSS